MVVVVVEQGNLTSYKVDAIVNPANSVGTMGGGVAYAIKKAGGDVIEDEAVSTGPTPVGRAVLTSAGTLPSKHVIHAPTMDKPAEQITTTNVVKATRAALERATENNLESIAFPGMGTGVGCVPLDDAAKAMVETIKDYTTNNPLPELIYLVGYSIELTECFRKWVVDLDLGTG